jgi:hypothetical protein
LAQDARPRPVPAQELVQDELQQPVLQQAQVRVQEQELALQPVLLPCRQTAVRVLRNQLPSANPRCSFEGVSRLLTWEGCSLAIGQRDRHRCASSSSGPCS